MFGLGMQEMVILLVIGVLLFGKRLPEVGRSLGKGIMEFKNGLKGMEDEFSSNSSNFTRAEPSVPAPRPPQRVAASAPKFEEPTPPV